MFDFREVLSFCDLHDLGFQGLPWTYDNKQKGDRNVRVRLDRAVTSPSWSQWFLSAQVNHLITVSTDHCLILLNLVTGTSQAPARRILRYEIMCKWEATLSEEIKKAWESCRPAADLGDVTKSLKAVMGELRSWSFNNFGAVTKELEKLKEEIEHRSRVDVVAN
jgi:hypothetical protein